MKTSHTKINQIQSHVLYTSSEHASLHPDPLRSQNYIRKHSVNLDE